MTMQVSASGDVSRASGNRPSRPGPRHRPAGLLLCLVLAGGVAVAVGWVMGDPAATLGLHQGLFHQPRPVGIGMVFAR